MIAWMHELTTDRRRQTAVKEQRKNKDLKVNLHPLIEGSDLQKGSKVFPEILYEAQSETIQTDIKIQNE